MGDAASSSANPGAAVDTWRVRAGLVYLSSGAEKMYEGKNEIDNYLQLKIKMQLATLMAGVDAPWGTGLTLILPYVKLHKEEALVDPIDYAGVGDLELRVRQDMTQALKLTSGPRWGLTLGAVAPTGVYLPGQTSKNFLVQSGGDASSTNREINIGRGVWWLLADGDVAYPINKYLLVHGGAQYRMPQGVAADGFAWGSELRANAGVRVTAIERYLSVGVAADMQDRGKATYQPESLSGPRVDYPNGGGTNAYVAAALYSSPTDWLSLSASYRVPVYANVNGQQIVQGPALFFAVSGNLSFQGAAPEKKPLPKLAVIGDKAKVPEIAALVVAGKITIVDYWATWCVPCMKLGPKLEEFAKARPAGDVVVQRVDATEWGAEQWTKFLPDAPGLPVLDIFDAGGILRARLEGEAAERYAEAVAAIAPAGEATPASK